MDTTESPYHTKPKMSRRCADCCLGAALASIVCIVISAAVLCTFIVLWNRNHVVIDGGNASEPVLSFVGDPKPELRSPETRADYTFDDIWDSSLRPRGFDGRWISGNELTTRQNGSLYKFNVDDETYTELVPQEIFEEVGSGTYWLSPDENYVLFAYDFEGLWRYSYAARYKIYEIGSNGTVTDFPAGPLSGEMLQYARWTSSGNALTFVYMNNLYFADQPSTSVPNQVTTSGVENQVFNGVPDWLYEEDVLGSPVSHYMSPDNRYLVYAAIDVTGVSTMSWPWYGPQTDPYGFPVTIAYPKPGDTVNGEAGPNSEVTLYVWDANNPTVPAKVISPPSSLASEDHYYTRVAFRDASHALVAWTNRVQNEGELVLCDLGTALCDTHMTVSEPEGWIEAPFTAPYFIEGGSRYLTVLPRPEGDDHGDWNQLAVVTSELNESGNVTFLTSGLAEVTGVAAYDDVNHTVYYISTNGDSTERHLFSINIDGGDLTCITCTESDLCRYVSVSFSATRDYFLQSCLGPDIPSYTIRQTGGGKALVMVDNAEVRARLDEKDLGTREFLRIPVGGGYEGQAMVTYPPGFNQNQKYPVIVDVYAGPGSQKVTKRFNLGSTGNNWYEFMRSEYGAVVVAIDARGSASRGNKYKHEINRRLCTVEVEDQITLAQYFKDQSWADDKKPVASFGWSYGGLVSSHLVSDESDAVECGIAVAPVTNFKYYDTAYTERYMGLATPADNEAGYNATDVMAKVENMRGRHYMLAHGTADDNVHFQQAAQLIRALNEADISYRTSLFIDQDHSILDPLQNRHLYHTMTNFIDADCGWGIEDDDNGGGEVNHATPLFNHVALFIVQFVAGLVALNIVL